MRAALSAANNEIFAFARCRRRNFGAQQRCPASAEQVQEKEKPKGEPKTNEKKDEPKKKPGLPLKSDRTIEFTTDEGTWVSLDVSPDGKTIVFDLLGDLYTLPIDGGDAKAITTGLAFDSQPRYSPDGKIDRVRERPRRRREPVDRRQATASAPRPLSKDKQSLFALAVVDARRRLRARLAPAAATVGSVRALDVSHPRRLRRAGHQGEDQARRSSAMTMCIRSAPSRRGTASICITPNETSSSTPTTTSTFPSRRSTRRDRDDRRRRHDHRRPGQRISPALSPDGTKLVYGTRVDNQTGLRIRDLASGEERWLKLPVQRDEQESRFTRDLIPGYAFTPDGKFVLAAYGGKIHRIDVQTGADPVIPISVRVSLPVGSRLNFPIRVDDGPVQARLIQEPSSRPTASIWRSRHSRSCTCWICPTASRGSFRRPTPASFTRAGRPTASRWRT